MLIFLSNYVFHSLMALKFSKVWFWIQSSELNSGTRYLNWVFGDSVKSIKDNLSVFFVELLLFGTLKDLNFCLFKDWLKKLEWSMPLAPMLVSQISIYNVVYNPNEAFRVFNQSSWVVEVCLCFFQPLYKL